MELVRGRGFESFVLKVLKERLFTQISPPQIEFFAQPILLFHQHLGSLFHPFHSSHGQSIY